jgi:hypothetical protein
MVVVRRDLAGPTCLVDRVALLDRAASTAICRPRGFLSAPTIHARHAGAVRSAAFDRGEP